MHNALKKMITKDLIGIKNLSAGDIETYLSAAYEMKALFSKTGKKSELFAGKNVSTLFFENSTRTRVSFEVAANYLGAHFSAMNASASSVSKGETLIDTGKNLDALRIDTVIMRHPMAGAAALLSKNVQASVINAGDGAAEHPTQALLDFFTIKEHLGSFKGKRVAICGDIKYSRVARSNIWGLQKLGASVTVCAPFTLLPCGIENFGVDIELNPVKAITKADVIMGLRVQLERQEKTLPSLAEYAKFFSITAERIQAAKATKAIIMHPGPVNRNVELSSEVIDCSSSTILPQVTNGVAVRMAVLNLTNEAKLNKGASK